MDFMCIVTEMQKIVDVKFDIFLNVGWGGVCKYQHFPMLHASSYYFWHRDEKF